MARLEAEVTANIGPFERALAAATEKAREFAEKTKDATKEVSKEVGGGQIFNLAGLAGGTAAIAAFAGAIKESLESFGHLQTQVLRLKATVKDADVAKEVHEWIESIALNVGEVDQLQSAFISLSESGMKVEAIKPVLVDLQAVAFKSGESVDSLAEAFRRAKAGGLDAGEGAARLLKSIPGLAAEINKYKEAAAKKIEFEAWWDSPAAQRIAEAKAGQIRAMTPADFVKSGQLNTDVLTKLIHQMAPREMVTEERGTLEGAEGQLSIELEKLKNAFGEGLTPSVIELVKTLTANLPSIETNLKEFGESLGAAVKFLAPLLGIGPPKPEAEKNPVQKATDALGNWENEVEDRLWNWLQSSAVPGMGAATTGSRTDLPTKDQQDKNNATLDQIAKVLSTAFG